MMAATVNPNAPSTPAANLSSRSSSVSGDGIGSPRPLRTSSGTGKTTSPPWTQIVVRGAESERLVAASPETPSSLPSETPASAAAVAVERNSAKSKGGASKESPEVESQPENSDNGGGGNASNKPVWNKSSNGAPDAGLVMGAFSWPTLSESTKASPKPPSNDPPSKSSSDASLSPPRPQVSGRTPATSSSLLTVPSSTSQRQVNNNPNPNSNHNPPNATPNHGQPARQRSMRREGGGNSSSNSGFSHQPPQFTAGLMGDALNNNNINNSSVKAGSGGSESSGREHGHNINNGNREGGQRGGGGDYTHQRSSFRRGNGGSHSRGDGSSHQGFGGRRDHDRGNHDWSHPKSFNGRDPAGPPQRGGSRGFMRPQPPPVPYAPPPLGMRPPYANPLGIPPEVPPLYYFAHPGMPYVPQMPPAFFFPPADPQLHAKILNQIDYYFSNENLIKDTYLRQNMDENGWVSVQLIAGFKKVKQLTTDIQLILDALSASTVVETQGEKIRRRNDWMKWIMPPSVQFPVASGTQSPRFSGQDYSFPARFQGLALDEKAAPSNNNSKAWIDSESGSLSRSSSGDQVGQQESSKDGSSSTRC